MLTDLLASTAAKVITGLVITLAVISFVLWLKWDDAEQPKQDARSANAAAETAKDAAETAIQRSADDASVDKLVERTAKLIDTLPPAEASKAARNAICQMPEYKDVAQCAK